MKAEEKTTQLRVIGRSIIAEGCAGQIFYATPTRARLLIDAKAAELVNVGPKETPVIGPSETKPMEPTEKKSSAAAQGGRLTASAPLIESGKGPSSSSAEALVSPDSKSNLPKRRGRPPKSK